MLLRKARSRQDDEGMLCLDLLECVVEEELLPPLRWSAPAPGRRFAGCSAGFQKAQPRGRTRPARYFSFVSRVAYAFRPFMSTIFIRRVQLVSENPAPPPLRPSLIAGGIGSGDSGFFFFDFQGTRPRLRVDIFRRPRVATRHRSLINIASCARKLAVAEFLPS